MTVAKPVPVTSVLAAAVWVFNCATFTASVSFVPAATPVIALLPALIPDWVTEGPPVMVNPSLLMVVLPVVTLVKVGVSEKSNVTASPVWLTVRLGSFDVTLCNAVSALAKLSLLAWDKSTVYSVLPLASSAPATAVKALLPATTEEVRSEALMAVATSPAVMTLPASPEATVTLPRATVGAAAVATSTL